jgi:hypothetical protein
VVLDLEAREIAVRSAYGRGVAALGLRQMNALVTAFSLGYLITDKLIDYWYSAPGAGSTGPDLSGYREQCRIGTGNYWDGAERACGSLTYLRDPVVQSPSLQTDALCEWSYDPNNWFWDNGTQAKYYPATTAAQMYHMAGQPYFTYNPLPAPLTLPAYALATPPTIPYAAIPYALAFADPLTVGGEPSLPVVALSDAYPRKPPPGVREKKWTMKFGWAGIAMNIATESIDAIDALFEALPEWLIAGLQDEKTFTRRDGTTFTKMVDRFPLVTVYEKETIRRRDGTLKEVNTNVIKYQFRSKGSAVDRALTVWNNAHHVDRAEALWNLAKNQAQDAAIGQATSATNKNLVKHGWVSVRGFSLPKMHSPLN